MSQIPLGYRQTADVSAVKLITDLLPVALVADGYPVATVAFIYLQAEAQNCRWRDDATDPTASVGQLLYAGQTLVLTRGQFNNFRIIEATGGAIVNLSAYRKA